MIRKLEKMLLFKLHRTPYTNLDLSCCNENNENNLILMASGTSGKGSKKKDQNGAVSCEKSDWNSSDNYSVSGTFIKLLV